MSQILEQQLSAFIDGELPDDELDLLLARLDRDPAHRATLARYAMIGECVRTGVASPAALRVAERVRKSLLADAEPAAEPQAARTEWRRWLAGAAAAAAAIVAFVMAGPGTLRLQQATPVTQDAATLDLMNEPLASVTTAAGHRLSPSAAARLTSYLVAHGQYTNRLSRSTIDSHLLMARAERASWHQFQDPNSGR